MENLYLEIEQILTDGQREKWQPIMVRRLVESEQEAIDDLSIEEESKLLTILEQKSLEIKNL